jgi:hypothetical protein
VYPGTSGCFFGAPNGSAHCPMRPPSPSSRRQFMEPWSFVKPYNALCVAGFPGCRRAVGQVDHEPLGAEDRL